MNPLVLAQLTNMIGPLLGMVAQQAAARPSPEPQDQAPRIDAATISALTALVAAAAQRQEQAPKMPLMSAFVSIVILLSAIATMAGIAWLIIIGKANSPLLPVLLASSASRTHSNISSSNFSRPSRWVNCCSTTSSRTYAFEARLAGAVLCVGFELFALAVCVSLYRCIASLLYRFAAALSLCCLLLIWLGRFAAAWIAWLPRRETADRWARHVRAGRTGVGTLSTDAVRGGQSYSITSSARASSVHGTSKPSPSRSADCDDEFELGGL